MRTPQLFRDTPRFALAALALGLSVSLVTGLMAQGSFTFFTLAGRPARGSSDGAGTAAAFNQPHGIAVASNGSIYVADTDNHVIRRIGTDGVVSTVAGLAGVSGSTSGVGNAARFTLPRALALTPVGVVYVADSNGVRQIDVDGTVSTLRSANSFYSSAVLHAIAYDGGSNLIVSTAYAVWRLPTAGGAPVLLAGTSSTGGYVDDTGSLARFNQAHSLALDSSGNIFVTDTFNQRIRKVTSAGVVTTIATLPAAADASAGALGLTMDSSGVMYASNTVTHNILRITQAGVVTVVAGNSGTAGSADGTGTAATFNLPRGISVASNGTLYVADTENGIIRAITTAGVVTTHAGSPGGSGNVDGTSLVARFNTPRGIAVSSTGTVYVADYNNCTIRSVSPGGAVSTFAGTVASSQADACGSTNGTGTAAKFSFPSGVAVDSTGNVFVADTTNNVIRKITPSGVTTTFAGLVGSSGSTDGTGSAARFSVPQGLTIDAVDNLYLADTGNHLIRKITPAGVVTTFAGTAGGAGLTDGTGTAARFNTPTGVTIDTGGNIYVADSSNNRIRRITSAGVVTVFAGSFQGYQDATGTSAAFNGPTGVAVDSAGNVYVADRGNNLIRRVTPAGVTTTVNAANTTGNYADGASASARFMQPYALAFDAAGNLYVSDGGNHAIRVGMLSATTPTITTHPSSSTVNSGVNATFTVAATGNLAPSVRWQVSTNAGTTWTDLSNTAPHSGVTTTTLTVAATVTQNNYRYRAIATNQSGSTASNPATLTVNYMTASPTALRFGAIKAGASGAITAVTPPQAVTVLFNGISSTWTASSNQPWAVVSGGSGNGNGRFTVSIANPSNVLGGSTSVSATITITQSSLASVTVPVTLGIDVGGASTQAPIGQMDTPAQNATGVQGAIAVTGWVLDDLGIASVKVYRNCLPAEPQANCQSGIVAGTNVVYVGDGQVVAGARPDVEAAFPTYAATNTAGWGIQVLTNMLPRTTGTFAPNGGQGQLTLYAVATDIEGNSTLLSRAYTDTVRTPTSITMDNDNIAKPFGTIDTPAEGSTVSGSIANFGWAITPDSNTTAETGDILIPTNGSTMFVFIDGVPVAPVAYNQCRGNVGNPVPAGVYCNDDISNIFGAATPQAALTTRTANATRYRNLDAQRAAIGAYIIDTSGLASGLHSLAWSVTDSANRTEGIGSRYFYVLNSADETPGDRASVAARAVQSRGAVSDLATIAVGSTVLGRSGFDLTAPLLPVEADAAGVRQVRIADNGRLELRLTDVDAGYLVANGSLRDLPAGSHLDATAGVFTWAPGPGFLGTYRLTFVGSNGQTVVDVTIAPDTATAPDVSEIRMSLDPVRSTPFEVRGTAFDPQAFTGSGIYAVHVWARRLDVPNASAAFVGAATITGRQYRLATPLPNGVYEVTVYAWNGRTGRWEDARSQVVSIR
jgi:hypothetical protein